MAVLAPEASKATTLDAGLTHYSFPIEKSQDTDTVNPVDGTPDIEIWGKATDGTLDSDLQVVDPDASLKWIKTWYDTKANIRMGHDPQRPVGRGIEIDGHYVKALIAEPTAKHLIRSKVLNDFSVGIMNPDIRVGDPRFKHLDPMGKAVRGVITDRPDGLTALGEISVVDRGSNFGSSFQIAKAAADGSPEFTGKLFAPDEVLAKAAAPPVTKTKGTVTVELPKNMSLSVKPSDLAKLATLRQKLAKEQGATKAAAPSVTKTAVPDTLAEYRAEQADLDVLAAFKAVGLAEDAILGKGSRTFSAEQRRGYASSEIALPDGSYPMPDADAVRRAAILIRSKHGNWKAAAKLLARRVKALKIPNPLKKKPAAEKTATPDAQKCACSGGMMDGKPCMDCKPGRRMAKRMVKKALTGLDRFASADSPGAAKDALADVAAAVSNPSAEKGKGKLRALCPGCGAKQNHKHVHCTECGRQLPAMPPMVAKNHDFMCLGCGHDLDKGEKHCPGCGKENPGHNPMADMKIPMNESAKAAEAGKDRVAKGKKKGKKAGKGEPFGGAQAKPFGSDDDGGKEPDAKDAKKTAKPKKTATKGKKPGIGKKPKTGHKPTPAEAGGVPGQHEMPAPPHREPDGGTVEAFEHDAHLEDGDSEKPTRLQEQSWKSADPETAAAMTLKALDVPQHIGALHALTCPAYSPEAVGKAFPHASFAGIDAAEWQLGALEKAASAPLAEAGDPLAIYHAAVTLKGADPYALADLRAQAHKAFRDANPGPASFPEPGQISPTRFNRPYIGEGHGAASPGYQGPHHAKLPEVGGIVAADHNRPYIEAGHAAESPSSNHIPGPMQAPSMTGHPTHEPAQGFMSSNAIASMQHAMSAMHDHISRRFPDVCPMEASMHIGSNPVPVPHGVPQPAKAPGARKAAKAAAKDARKTRKAAKAKARKAAKAMAAKRRKIGRKVLKGSMSVADARVKMGLKPIAPPESPTSAGAAAPVAAALDPAMLEAAIAKATAKATKPLAAALGKSQKAQRRQGKAFRKLQKTTDAIASQPDTSQSPMRMAALTKSTASAAPVAPQTVSGSAEQAQITKMQLLQNEWRNSPDPSQREAAYAELTQMLGVNSMTPPSPMTIPMRT